jgi:drug/metabolite transporter (DMT)-like permease
MRAVRFSLLMCVTVWGWTFVATKICLETLRPIEIVGLRFLIGLPILFFLLRAKRIPIRFGARDIKAIAIGSSIIAVHFLMQAYALLYTSATKTGWLIGVSPLALAVLSFLFLHEKPSRSDIAGIVIATIGIALLVYNGELANFGWLRSFGDIIVLASAFTWSVYTIVSRDLSRAHNPLTVTLVMFVPLTVIASLLMIANGSLHLAALTSVRTTLALLFLGGPAMLAQWVWQEGVARLGATKAGLFLYLEPVATTALAVPYLGEAATLYTISGGLLVLTGVWLAGRSRKQEPHRKS